MRLKNVFFICAVLLVVALAVSPGLAQEEDQPAMSLIPLLQEQLVYSWNIFDGKGWSGGFIPGNEDTIYLIADKDNGISAKKTLIYFWPITAKFMAGWQTLSEETEGTLELLKDGQILQKLEKQDMVLAYPGGYWAENIVFYKAEEAREWYQKYKDAEKAYYAALNEFYDAQADYQKNMSAFFEEVRRRRDAGEEGPLDIRIPKEPQPPAGPSFYVTEPQKNYIINLPVGTYQIRLRAEDGTIAEGSEKNVLVFNTRRKEGVGYEIIPGNRWTRREQCNDPANTIYAAGRNLLYFIPFSQDEYNELYHNKLLDPQNEGREESWKWVHTTPIEKVILSFYGQGKTLQQVTNKPFKVQQIPGAELGYNIVEFDQEGAFPGDQPTFEGYQLVLSEDLASEGYKIYLQKEETNIILSGSERDIRLVKRENANYLYYLSIFPLIVGAIVFTARRRKVKK